jgi:uncharacterized protein
MAHAINWFEIPAADFERAKKFYETVLGSSLVPMDSPGRKMGAFAADWSKGEVSGCVVEGEGAVPTAGGTMVFLNCSPDLALALARVEQAGGKVIMPKMQIPMQGAGWMAIICDSEGNTVGLHSES